jgi:hypothetical protein
VTLQATQTSVPKDEIKALIVTLSGLVASRVVWDGEVEKMVGPVSGRAGRIVLNVTARATNGREEVRRSLEDAVGDQPEGVVDSWGANRILTISMRADNFLGLGEAFDTLERLRMRLVREASRLALREVGLAFVEATNVIPINYNVDNRPISSASVDLRVAQTIVDRDEDDNGDAVANSWIENVDVIGTVSN